MIELVTAHATSTAPSSAFFARWIDHSTWTSWDTDTEWVRLDGPPAVGGTGVLKPAGGPKVRFRISALVPDREYTDISTFLGAKLTFRHLAEVVDGRTRLTATVTITGPLSRLWAAVLRGGFVESVPAALDRLVAQVEAEV